MQPLVSVRRSALLIFSILLGVSAASVTAAPSARHKRSAWTMMIYMDADNSLETPLIRNVNELLQVGSSADVQFVLLCDRSPKSEPSDQYTDEQVGGMDDWHGARLLHVERDSLKMIANWKDTNMADPTTLRRFLEAGKDAYPADHYGLIISDHGSGWSSLCVDATHGEAFMTLRDLRAAIEPFVKENGKLELVGLDACLLGSFETAQALAPVAHYLVASEELAPARGWNYDRLAHDLVAKPTSNGYDIGRLIIDAYTIHFRESKDPLAKYESMGITLSMMELDHFQPLSDAVSELAEGGIASLKHGRDGWIKVARARVQSEEFGADGVRGESHEEEMHDLRAMAVILEKCGDPAVEAAATKVDEALRKMIRYGMHGPCSAASGGISIYFPTDGISLHDELGAAYLKTTFAKENKWVNFLSLYSVAVDDYAKEPTLLPLKFTGTTAAIDQPITILSKSTDTDIAHTHFLLLGHSGNDLVMLGRLPVGHSPDGTVGKEFRGLWFMLSNKKALITCPITSTENLEGPNMLAYVPLQIKRAGSDKWIDVEFTFMVNMSGTPHGQAIFGFTASKEGPRQVSIKAGDSVRPVYTLIRAAGGAEDMPAGGGFVISDPSDFQLEWGLVSKGPYKLGFEIENYAGQTDMVLGDFDLK